MRLRSWYVLRSRIYQHFLTETIEELRENGGVMSVKLCGLIRVIKIIKISETRDFRNLFEIKGNFEKNFFPSKKIGFVLEIRKKN